MHSYSLECPTRESGPDNTVIREHLGSRDNALVKQTDLELLELKYQQKDKINVQIVLPCGQEPGVCSLANNNQQAQHNRKNASREANPINKENSLYYGEATSGHAVESEQWIQTRVKVRPTSGRGPDC